jgi:hypothetical protein
MKRTFLPGFREVLRLMGCGYREWSIKRHIEWAIARKRRPRKKP